MQIVSTTSFRELIIVFSHQSISSNIGTCIFINKACELYLIWTILVSLHNEGISLALRRAFYCLSLAIFVSSNSIQGDSGGTCTTLGNDSMSDYKHKSSYEHGSDFERLRSFGHFLIPVHALM
jgi:hypothetical protein